MIGKGMSLLALAFVLASGLTYHASADEDAKVVSTSDPKAAAILTAANKDGGLSNGDLTAFIRQVLEVQSYESMEAGQCLVADLNGDGKKDVVISVNGNCTSDPIMLVLSYEVDGVARTRVFTTEWGDVTRDVPDLDGDGKREIVTKTVLTENVCHADCVEWPTVYRWSGDGYVEASAQFPLFYGALEQSLLFRLRGYEAQGPESYGERRDWAQKKALNIAGVKVGMFKARQMQGDKTAGLDEARVWASSSEELLRENAVIVLDGMDKPDAKKLLSQLAQDAEESVSRRAKTALKGQQERSSGSR